MDRAERIGIGVAVVAHVVLFGALSAGWLDAPEQEPETKAIEVSLVDAVALDSASPQEPEPPAQSRAPDAGPPEDAAPPAPSAEPEPEPAPPAPKPKPAPPPKPAPVPPEKKPPPAKPDKAKAAQAKSATPPTRKPGDAKATGTTQGARNTRSTGSILNDDFRKGLTQSPSTSKAATAPGATMSAQAAADIGSAILRQVQPCADRQVNPARGQAERIRVTIRLKLNRDGSLAARPVITGHAGVDEDNRRYVEAVDRLAIATFTGCSPLRGLPPELYNVPRGWSTFSLRYKLPG